MEIEEAIEVLEKNYPDPCYSMLREAVDIAILALKKQIGKRPLQINTNGTNNFDGNWKKVCPVCQRVLVERITTDEISYPRHYNMSNYCQCGQKLKWDE